MPYGLIGAGLGAVAGLANVFSARSQNNEARRQFEESLNFQKYQYNDMKRYNSPKNQMRLLREAGINPALSLGNLGQSTAVGVGSASPTASNVMPDMSGLVDAGNIVSMIGNRASERSFNIANALKATNEASGQAIDNMYKDKDWRLSLRGKDWTNALLQQQGYNAQLAGTLAERTLQSNIQQQFYESETAKAVQGYQLKLLSTFDERFAKEMSLLYSQAYQAVLSGEASVKQAAAAMMNSETSQAIMQAQFGSNKADRARFFGYTLDNLWQGFKKAQSEEWRNYNSLRYGIKTPLFGFDSNLPTQMSHGSTPPHRRGSHSSGGVR